MHFLCFLIGSSWILTSMVKDFTNNLQKLNILRKSSNRAQWETQWRFFDIVERLSETKQLSKISQESQICFAKIKPPVLKSPYSSFRLVNAFNKIYEYTIFAVFSWTLSTICCNLLVLQINLVTLFSCSSIFHEFNF